MAERLVPPSGKPRKSIPQSPITAANLTVWAKAGRTHRYPCGDGLYFQTKPTSASWVFRFRFGRGRKAMGLGAFPEVGLLAARERAGRARRAIQRGRDPIAERAVARARFVDGGVDGVPRPMTMQEAVATYGDRADKEVWCNAKGDIKKINEILLRSTLTRALVRAELLRRGFPNAGRVRLADIPPVLLAFSADPRLPPLTVALLKLYHQDNLKRGDTATALVLACLAESKAATKLWEGVKRRKGPPIGRGGPFDSSRTAYGGNDQQHVDTRAYRRPTVLVDLYRDPDTRPDLLRLLEQASNKSDKGSVTLQQVCAWLDYAADHEFWERQCITAQLLAMLAERATRPDQGTIAEIERRGREALDEGRAADVLREHGLPDQAPVHTQQAVKHFWCAQNLAKEWSPNATELICAVRGELSWQIGGLGNVGTIATELVAAALNLNQPISRFLARRRNKAGSAAGKRESKKRARALVCHQLKHGWRPESSVKEAAEAAEIPGRVLNATVEALGVIS